MSLGITQGGAPREIAARAAPETGLASEATKQRSIVLVGLMGAGKTTIGRKLAARLGLPFRDADAEIERAGGRSIAEIFAIWGEPEFREGERRVIARLLADGPMVLATGGGAFMEPRTRAAIREGGISVWLRSPLSVLVRRVTGRTHRPLLATGNPREILAELMRLRDPFYAEADIVIDSTNDQSDDATQLVLDAIASYRTPRRVQVGLERHAYDITVGSGLIARAGAHLGPVLPQKRAFIISDETVAALYLPALRAGLEQVGIVCDAVLIPAGERSKSLASFGRVTEAMLAAKVERRTAVIALGGGVVGDLAGFAAATVLRGMPLVQIPTTLLSQVDSSVGGKTGINTARGKNLIGAFHQPIAVLADTDVLSSLPPRELRAGYAEILKAGLIGDAPLFDWCLAHGAELLAGEARLQEEAIIRACTFKARVVGDDEREEKPSDGRALLNLGHSFGHALEAELGYDGRLLHGEAVAIGLGLALELSASLGLCDASDGERVRSHLKAVGLLADISVLSQKLGRGFAIQALLEHMQRDKKMRDGRLTFVLSRGVGRAFTSSDVPQEAVVELLRAEGCGDAAG